MSTLLLPLEPNDEIVAVAWIASVPGLSDAMVGTTLPPDVNQYGRPTWASTGYVTVAVAGGNPDALLPVNRPVIQVDCWASVPGSGKPPWLQAAAIAQAIQHATWERHNISRPLSVSAGGVAYPRAIVQGASMATSFRRIYDDAGDYARYQGDLWLSWITPGERLA